MTTRTPYAMGRSLLLTQYWSILSFASTSDTLTFSLLSDHIGALVALGALLIIGCVLTLEWFLSCVAGIRTMKFKADIGTAYAIAAGLLAVECYALVQQAYFGTLLWLYASLAVHSSWLAWVLVKHDGAQWQKIST